MEGSEEANRITADSIRPYPAPGRPEQPMQTGSSSAWAWVVGGALVVLVLLVLPIVVLLVFLATYSDS